MQSKAKLSVGILLLVVLFLLLSLVLRVSGRWTITIVSAPDPLPPAQPGIVSSETLTFTAAVKDLGTTETGKQDVNLGRLEQPGRYVLQLANDNSPLSNHWIEWDYLALKVGGSFGWQIGQEETPPIYGSVASDEFCGTAEDTDCRAGFEVVAGRIDERSFPKTLNDGVFPVVRIVFTATPEQKGADFILTLSTLYSSHLPETRDFKMQVTLYGPY